MYISEVFATDWYYFISFVSTFTFIAVKQTWIRDKCLCHQKIRRVFLQLHSRKVTWTLKMMVWKRHFLSTIWGFVCVCVSMLVLGGVPSFMFVLFFVIDKKMPTLFWPQKVISRRRNRQQPMNYMYRKEKCRCRRQSGHLPVINGVITPIAWLLYKLVTLVITPISGVEKP